MDKWVMENVSSIMFVVGVVGFAMVGSLFVIYFVVSRNVKKKKQLAKAAAQKNTN